MYNVAVTNNYTHGLYLDGGNKIVVKPNGGATSFTKWGSHALTVPWMGDINFIDMGEKKINAFTSDKIPWTERSWGGLVRYRTLDAYFRYEGGGNIELVVDQFGSISLHFAQGGMMVNLADMTVT